MVNLPATANALWIDVATISSPAAAENPDRAISTMFYPSAGIRI
jgi:hypothetical protein